MSEIIEDNYRQFPWSDLDEVFKKELPQLLHALQMWNRMAAYAEIGIDNLKDIKDKYKLLFHYGNDRETQFEGIKATFQRVFNHGKELLTKFTMVFQLSQDPLVIRTKTNIEQCLKEMIRNCFVIKEQEQVLKTKKNFNFQMESLLSLNDFGGQLLNFTCDILNERQEICGAIENNRADAVFNDSTKTYGVSFKIFVKDIARCTGRCALDEMFTLKFHANILFGETIEISVCSIPVVVTVHASQNADAYGTVFWSNAFSDCQFSNIVDQVLWRDLKVCLNKIFALKTGRELTEKNLEYFYRKLFSDDENLNRYVTRNELLKKKINGHSFWEWLFNIMQLIQNPQNILHEMWKEFGLIEGFISRESVTNRILLHKPVGTFLIRFTDSELGKVSISYVKSKGLVESYGPIDLTTLRAGFAEFIMNNNKFTHVWSFALTSPKEIFNKYIKRETKKETPPSKPPYTNLIIGILPVQPGNENENRLENTNAISSYQQNNGFSGEQIPQENNSTALRFQANTNLIDYDLNASQCSMQENFNGPNGSYSPFIQYECNAISQNQSCTWTVAPQWHLENENLQKKYRVEEIARDLATSALPFYNSSGMQ